MVSSLTALASRGVLVKGGAYLDVLARARLIAFDKTGTLTLGHPTVTQARSVDCVPTSGAARPAMICWHWLPRWSGVQSIHSLWRLWQKSKHASFHIPTRRQKVSNPLPVRVYRVTRTAAAFLVGSHDLFHRRDDRLDQQLHANIQSAVDEGQTVMLVGKDDSLLGYVTVADAPRPTSAEALRQLKAINPSIRTVMLTGDNPVVASKVAIALGSLDEVRAGLLPEDKLEAVHALQAQHGFVLMVGDGVNDAPALAAADAGIAMGGAGSAQAMETADVVLMQDDLTQLPGAIRTAYLTQKIIKQNIAFSLAIKAAFLLLTLPGLATLWLAVFADMGASLLVTLNGMRMLRSKN